MNIHHVSCCKCFSGCDCHVRLRLLEIQRQIGVLEQERRRLEEKLQKVPYVQPWVPFQPTPPFHLLQKTICVDDVIKFVK